MQQQRPYTIAHTTDLDPEGGIAFEHAVGIACRGKGKLFTLYAAQEGTAQSARTLPNAQDLLNRWGSAKRPLDCSDHASVNFERMVHTCCEDPVDTLLDALSDIEPDLLVVGKHRTPGIWGYIHDSVAESLALNAQVPTLFVPIGGDGFISSDRGRCNLERILVPVESERTFLQSVQAAHRLVEALDIPSPRWSVLHVGEEKDAEDLMAPELDPPIEWELIHRPEQDLAEAILEEQDRIDADLLVMGTRGHDSLADIFRGSQTERVGRRTRRPLLSVPLQ